jgi:branched-chain amino acid transport system ATP-binding protein
MSSTAADTATTALSVQQVTAGYGKTTVLRDIDLILQPGQVTALLGPNGAGKTTLIRTIAGELSPGKGTIRVGNADVTRQRPERRVRAGVCTIPEGRGIFRSLTVRENLVLHNVPGSREDAIETALTAFPALRERLKQRAGSMSGGQQQQLALARCVTTNPAVILLDEVSMGLSPRVVDDIFEAIGRLAQTGVALLLVEQYVARALEIADTVAVLDKGEISFNGAAADVDAEELTQRYLSR